MKKTLLLFSFFCLSLYAGQEDLFVNPQDQALQAIFNEMDKEMGLQEFATAQQFATALEQEPNSFSLENNTAQTDPSLQNLFPTMEVEGMGMELVPLETNPQGHARSLPSAPRAQKKKHKCTWTDCDKAFTKKSHLTYHMNIHTGIKSFKCQYCNKDFAQLGHRRDHERIHTGEKPFKCQYCNKAFTQQSSLKAHESIHTGIKPFKCQYCNTGFAQLGHRRDHERIHTGEKPFKCSICGKAFTNSSSRTRHKKNCQTHIRRVHINEEE